MKRILYFALLIFIVLGLPVTVVHAQTMAPGCNPQMWGYLEDHANAIRARNRAYEREILNRQESTLYLTCFDQAMVVSSKLGIIFSDAVIPGPPPANTNVFQAPLAYQYWGAPLTAPGQGTLAMDLDFVVNPIFDNWLDAPVPAPALFNFLPQWLEQKPVVLNNQLTQLVAAQQSAVAAIVAFQTGADTQQAQQYLALVNQIDTLVKGLPSTALEQLQTQNTTYTTDIGNLQTLLGTVVSTRSGSMTGLIQTLNAVVNGFPFSCTRVDDLWDKMDPAYTQNPAGYYQAGTFYPPDSPVYYPFSPYYTLDDFLGVSSANPPANPPTPPTQQTPKWQSVAPSATSATADFVQELGDATDNAALQQAMSDLTGQAPLAGAGQNAIWPAPPTFQKLTPLNAQGVINQM